MNRDLTAYWDHDGEVLVLTGDAETMANIKRALADVLPPSACADDIHAHCTFYAESERTKSIYGFTDDEEARVETRDGEQPVATIRLFACK